MAKVRQALQDRHETYPGLSDLDIQHVNAPGGLKLRHRDLTFGVAEAD